LFNSNIFKLYIYFVSVIDIVRDIYYEDVVKFYQVQHKETKEFFILRRYPIVLIAHKSSDLNSVDPTFNRSKEIEEKIQKFEEFVEEWKAAMAKSEYIGKYIDHWYDDDKILLRCE
jgi:hypothetical protein